MIKWTFISILEVRPNNIIPLFPEKRVTKKKPTREAGKTFILYFNPEKNFRLILMLPSLNSRKMFHACSNKSISRQTTVVNKHLKIYIESTSAISTARYLEHSLSRTFLRSLQHSSPINPSVISRTFAISNFFGDPLGVRDSGC